MPGAFRGTSLVLACTSLVAVSGVLASFAVGDASPSVDAAQLRESEDAVEVARIRLHFDSVLVELRRAPVSHLTAQQRQARTAHIAELAGYRDRGVFPHNHEFAEVWTPYFVDHRGVLCAMAHLLEQSGRRDIVDRVAATDNNILVAELAGDLAFTAWLDSAGLTLAEAARIQPTYDHTPAEPRDRVDEGMALLSVGVGGAAIAWNALADGARYREARAALGFAGGALGIALAARHVDDDGTALAVGVTTGAIGLASAILGARALFGSHLEAPVPASPSDTRGPMSFSIAPSLTTNRSGMAPGLTLGLRF